MWEFAHFFTHFQNHFEVQYQMKWLVLLGGVWWRCLRKEEASRILNFRATQYITPTLPYSWLYIRIRVSGCLILPCLWLKAIIITTIIIITNIFFCTSYFPSGNLSSCLGFAASSFDKLLSHCSYNASQLMLFCVSLHVNFAFIRLTVSGWSCLKIVNFSLF